MKSTIIKLTTLLSVCFILFAAMAYKPAKNETVTGKGFNAYWVTKSGEEYTIMEKTTIPDGSYEKDSKGEFKGMDKEVLKSSLHYSNKKEHNGKQIEKHFFVVTSEDNAVESDMNSVSPGSKTTYPKTFQCSVTNYLCLAITQCYYGGVPGWNSINSCKDGGGAYGFCTAYQVPSGKPYAVYCQTN
jgi:hypothetical protein